MQCILSIHTIFLCVFFLPRYGKSRGTWAGRTRLPHALPPGLPRVPAWDDEALLEEGARRKADLWIHPVLFGRLLHSHRATVPARRQPLVWWIWGQTVASYRGTSEESKAWGNRELQHREKPWWGCRERCKLVQNHCGISVSARRKCFLK